MSLRLVKLSKTYKRQLFDMMDEWTASGEKIIPYAIRKVDYHDFEHYMESLELREPKEGLVPDSTFFCLDEDRDIFVGAVNIRHYLNDALLKNGGHIGDGIRPSERRKGYASKMIPWRWRSAKSLALIRCLWSATKRI